MQRGSSMTPGSERTKKKQLNIDKLREYFPEGRSEGHQLSFVLGVCGGDCAGKKQLINYMFVDKDGQWKMKDTGDRVTIIHQDIFTKDKVNKYRSQGTNWELFEKTLLNLLAGNEQMVKNAKNKQGNDVLFKPAKLIIVEGCHIFMKNLPICRYIDSKIFIDSDSDVRLSRRIYKDTQDDGKNLNDSIANYLAEIKPSYEKEIEPCKSQSDIIIPHFGGGYDDHRKEKKVTYSTNIHNAKSLILAHIKEAMALSELQK